jgi:zinc transport system ATP-binding protein
MMELDISNLAERPVSALSGGQLQRVLIARALAVEPQILLLDEPTASLDANSRDQIHNLLQKLNEKVTIIMVTHDMGVISTHVRSIACLNQTLHYHGDAQLSPEAISKTFGCAVDLIAHGVPHRHLDRHAGDKGCCDV